MIDVVIDISCIYGGDAARAAADDEHDPKPADSHCIITLNNGTALFLREVNRSLRARLHPEGLRAPPAGPPRVQLQVLPPVALRALPPAARRVSADDGRVECVWRVGPPRTRHLSK